MSSSGRYQSQHPEGAEEDALAHYWVRVGKKDIPLEHGETVIGRGESCHIVVNENLVSRKHARIVLDGGRPYIEDLGSANGTFVNQARLHGRALLFPGDHVFVGTAELEVIRRIDEDRPTLPLLDVEERLDRPTPASGVGAFSPVQPSQAPSSRPRSSDRRTAAPTETTTDVDGIEYLGRLADKMFTMGRIDAALKILTSQIQDVLAAVRAGKSVPPSVVDAAGRYAVKLANETLDSRWVDMAVEIHLTACRPMREETVQNLAALRSKAPLGDDILLGRYYDRLRSRMASMTPAERMLCERVACLLPGLGSGR